MDFLFTSKKKAAELVEKGLAEFSDTIFAARRAVRKAERADLNVPKDQEESDE